MHITKQLIMQTAIDIVNRDGMSGLSMRKIANCLQIAAPSLYFHVKDKQEIWQQITETVSLHILEQLSDKTTLFEMCVVYRTELESIRDCSQIFSATPPVTPKRVESIEYMLNLIREMGVDEMHLIACGNLVNNYVLSFVADQAIWREQTDVKTEFSHLIVLNEDEQFEYGLNVILNGMQQAVLCQKPY